MGIDRAGDGSDASIENVENNPPADRRPPPPPDRPGADGYPSRADSRNGAAAANDASAQTSTGEVPEKTRGAGVEESADGEDFNAADERGEAQGASEGAQLHKSEESPANGTDSDGGQIDINAGSSSADSPAAPETVDNLGDTGLREQPFEAHDTPGENTESIDQPSTNVAQQTDNEHLPDNPTAESEESSEPEVRASDSTGLETANKTATESRDAQETTTPLAKSETQGLAYERPDVHPESISNSDKEPEKEAPAVEANTDQAELIDSKAGLIPGDAESSSTTKEAASGEIGDRSLSEFNGRTDANDSEDRIIAAPVADRPHELTQADESSEKDETASLGNDTSPADELETSTDEPQQETDPWKYDISVQHVPLEEFLDRTGGDYRRPDDRDTSSGELPDEGPIWVEKRSDLPGGEELRDMDSDKLSRFDRMRKSAFKKAGDIINNSKEYVNSGHDALGRPPVGSHTEVRSPQPELTDAAHHGATVGDLMTGVLVATMLTGEGGRHLYRRLVKKGDGDDRHR